MGGARGVALVGAVARAERLVTIFYEVGKKGRLVILRK